MSAAYAVEPLPAATSPVHPLPPRASSPPIKVMPPLEESTLHVSPSAPVHAPPTPSTPSVAIRLAGTALVLVAPQLDFFAGGNCPLSGAKQVLKVSGSFQPHCTPHVIWQSHVTFGSTTPPCCTQCVAPQLPGRQQTCTAQRPAAGPFLQ